MCGFVNLAALPESTLFGFHPTLFAANTTHTTHCQVVEHNETYYFIIKSQWPLLWSASLADCW